MTDELDVSYSRQVVRVLQTPEFSTWLRKLKDQQARNRILRRLDRLAQGSPGDARPIGEGLSELRVHTGPGYRIYYLRDNEALILLLAGGDKSTQQRDIEVAHNLAAEWRSEKEKREP